MDGCSSEAMASSMMNKDMNQEVAVDAGQELGEGKCGSEGGQTIIKSIRYPQTDIEIVFCVHDLDGVILITTDDIALSLNLYTCTKAGKL